MATALRTIALKEGYTPECLYQEVRVCSAFTEHPATRLRLRASVEHSRSCPIPALRAAEASARKTSLDDFGRELLTGLPNAPPEFQKREFIAADLTVRGLRNAS